MIYKIILIGIGFLVGLLTGLILQEKYRILSYYLRDKNKSDNLNY